MLKSLLVVAIASFVFGTISLSSHAGEDPRIPVEAVWGMTIEQVQQLVELDRNETGTLRNSYVIRGAVKQECVALWRDRPISFYIAKDIGLYAINIEMAPYSLRHTQAVADQELVDIEQYAPIRFAILHKYGSPLGIVPNWDAEEISPLEASKEATMGELEQTAIQWTYTRNWLVWEGPETRLALGEQSIGYASRVGLLKLQRQKRSLAREQKEALDAELAQQIERQQRIEAARALVPSRASAFVSFF